MSDFEPGWLGKQLVAAEAEFATWSEGMRNKKLADISDVGILGGIELSECRLTVLYAEAYRRGINPQ